MPDEETFEEPCLFTYRDAGPVILYGPFDHPVGRTLQAYGDPAGFGREVMCVRDEIEQCLLEAATIAVDAWSRSAGNVELHNLTSALREGLDGGNDGLAELHRVERAKLKADRTGSVAREIEDVVNEALHPLCVPLHLLEHCLMLLGGWVRRRFEQQAGDCPDDGDRSPQLV